MSLDHIADERVEYGYQQRRDDAYSIEQAEASIECPDCGGMVWYDADDEYAMQVACAVHDQVCENRPERVVIDGWHVEIVSD